jgi:hypothetical protein
MDKGIANLKERGVIGSNQLGCTDAQIAEIQGTHNFKLPSSYIYFLKKLGVNAGDFYLGTDIFYPIVLELKEWAHELLKEHDIKSILSEDSFVFSMHQGYQFMYFNCSEGDDPPVYHYFEGDSDSKKIAKSFSDFFYEVSFESWSS